MTELNVKNMLKNLIKISIYSTFAIILGVLTIELVARKPPETANQEILNDIAIPDSATQKEQQKNITIKPSEKETKTELQKSKLDRFKELRTKALLNDQESVEKQRLLSNLQTARSIENKLSQAAADLALGDRLSMVDFLEECVTWTDNPIRNEVFDSIERTISAKNLAGSIENRRQAIGDKIELFTVLAQQTPERARALKEKVEDARIGKAIDYAIRRLALGRKLSEN